MSSPSSNLAIGIDIDQVMLPMAVASTDGVLVRVNVALCRLVGQTPETLVGGQLGSFATPPDDVMSGPVHHVNCGERAGEYLQEWRRPHGSPTTIHVRVAWTLVGDPTDGSAYLTYIVVDQTGQAEAERELARSETRFRARFVESGVPQVFCDQRGAISEVNDAFCTMLGLARDQLVGRPVSDLNHHTDDGQADTRLQQMLAGGSQSSRVVRTLRNIDNRPVPVIVDAHTLEDDGGSVIGLTAHLHDLSQLRAVESLRQQQEAFFVAMAQRATDVAIVADADGRIEYTSPGLARVLGYTSQDLITSLGWDLIHPDDIPAMRVKFDRVAAGGETETGILRVRNAAGEWRWVEETMHNCLDTAVQGIVCNLRDITERMRAEDEQESSALLYRTIAENVRDGVWLTTDDGASVYVNDRMVEILGVERDDILAQPAGSFLDPHEAESLAGRFAARSARGPERYEVLYDHPDGTRRTLSIAAAPVGPVGGRRAGSLAMVSDITEARHLESELRRAALYDSLAGLPNRTLLMDRLKHALTRERANTAVLFVDLDHFKQVNDVRGHDVGDEVLVRVAARLSTTVRPSDTVSRLGGDEFVVICEDTDAEEADAVARDVLSALASPLALASGVLHITASVGIAVSPTSSAETLVRHADTAMYAAKVAGRGRIQHFDSRLAAHTEERRELGNELARALREDELTMHYQPIVDLQSGRVVGMEALARWDRADGGPVSPDRFVAIAEETGLAHQLDRWAVGRALGEVSELRDEGAVHADSYVAVNISALNLSNPQLEKDLNLWTLAANLPPRTVQLEITESGIMDDPVVAVALLHRLRKAGFKISVDDFGTGHSSLAYLRNLPVTTLKIDRSFVAEIPHDRHALAIVASIIDLAGAMGLSVIAEGVETPRHAELLRDLGCDAAQGWLWSHAVAPDELRRAHTMVRTHDVTATSQSPAGGAHSLGRSPGGAVGRG